MTDIHQLVSEHKDLIINTRRDLHRIPETAYTEKKTSAYVIDYLNTLELDVQTEIAQYGVVGLLKTGKPGPTLMLRADMDALPLNEPSTERLLPAAGPGPTAPPLEWGPLAQASWPRIHPI